MNPTLVARTRDLESWWNEHGGLCMRAAIVVMIGLAVGWLGYEFWRLLFGGPPIWDSSPAGAIDLRIRHRAVERWFAGQPAYEHGSVDPPASYVMLWPFVGWLSWTATRWLWAATTVGVLGWLVATSVRESGAVDPRERLFVALMPLSMYATGAAVGNGQQTIHLMVALLAAILWLQRRPPSWGGDLFAGLLMLLSLARPNLSAPFFWLVVFLPGRLRPALLVVLGYAGLTLWAASFQEPGVVALLGKWLDRGALLSGGAGHAHLQLWMQALGWERWSLHASLLSLAVLGFWCWRHRRADLWLQIGVVALVARLWVYHGWYDDLLILLPLLATFRIAKQRRPGDPVRILAVGLLASNLVALLAPGALYLLEPPWRGIVLGAQLTGWIALLAFLLARARADARVSG